MSYYPLGRWTLPCACAALIGTASLGGCEYGPPGPNAKAKQRDQEYGAHQAIDKASLTDTYWRPVEIDGKPVGVAAGQREPHMVLGSEHRLRGFGGCNQIQGGYEVQGNGLRFIGMATTRMFCQESMEQEAAFLLAMEATATYAIAGETLELFDASGRPVARFESRHLR